MTTDAAFDTALRIGAPGLACRPERADDQAFLACLFVACSPLATLLPAPMLHQQAAIRYDAYRSAFPQAMRRIALSDGMPIGRIVIDWGQTGTHCVDIAVLPDRRATGTGTHLLRAWLSVADAFGRPATLEVQADNPAMRLYARLGFTAVDGDGVMVTMARPLGAAIA